MLLTKEVEVLLTGENVKYYEDLGYKIPRYKNVRRKYVMKRNTKIVVNIKDLQKRSGMIVEVICSGCNKLLKMPYMRYTTNLKENDEYFCLKCANVLITKPKMLNTKLLNSISFEQWCIDNNKQDILDQWDYDLNKCKPSEICFKSSKKYYFKCLRNLHKSEKKTITSITTSKGYELCNKCKSFAQWGIDNLGEDFLEKYWDYDKNKISPWNITSQSNSKVWLKCPDMKHGSYCRTVIHSYKANLRCPSCSTLYKGEKRIDDYLLKNNISYIPQKTFDHLIGTGGGLLSYDFFLPNYNLLIEYQGEFHDGNGNYYIKSKLNYQKEHDKRKKEYAHNNNIKLLEIWYYDFDNIEEILNKELNI